MTNSRFFNNRIFGKVQFRKNRFRPLRKNCVAVQFLNPVLWCNGCGCRNSTVAARYASENYCNSKWLYSLYRNNTGTEFINQLSAVSCNQFVSRKGSLSRMFQSLHSGRIQKIYYSLQRANSTKKQ